MSELDGIYDAVDRLMAAGRLMELDSILAGIRIDVTPTDLLIGYLTATLPVKGTLPARKRFYGLVRKILKARNVLDDGLLKGLE